MIEQQVRPWDVLDDNVLNIMANTPRERFVEKAYSHLAYADLELPIGHQQLMLQPRVEGRIMQELNISPTDKVYEVGTGSGYLTACLSQAAEHVTSIEIHDDLLSQARSRLRSLGCDNLSLSCGDALSQKDTTQYDVIIITGSLPTYDDRFELTLKQGGRLFVVTGDAPAMRATVVTKTNSGFERKTVFETILQPLIGAEKNTPFIF